MLDKMLNTLEDLPTPSFQPSKICHCLFFVGENCVNYNCHIAKTPIIIAMNLNTTEQKNIIWDCVESRIIAH